MLSVRTTLTDRATPVVIAVSAAMRPERLKPIVGRAGVNIVRQHLFACDRSKPNALGGTRTHFYADAARGTHFDVTEDGVLISINQVGIRQRVLGGTIVAKTKKFLTIPVAPEAHGKRASEFDDLVVVFGAKGQPIGLAHALFRVTQKQLGAVTARNRVGLTRTGNQHGGLVFLFKKSVTQQPDPSVIPTTLDLAAGIKSAVNDYVGRAAARARGTTGGPSS